MRTTVPKLFAGIGIRTGKFGQGRLSANKGCAGKTSTLRY